LCRRAPRSRSRLPEPLRPQAASSAAHPDAPGSHLAPARRTGCCLRPRADAPQILSARRSRSGSRTTPVAWPQPECAGPFQAARAPRTIHSTCLRDSRRETSAYVLVEYAPRGCHQIAARVTLVWSRRFRCRPAGGCATKAISAPKDSASDRTAWRPAWPHDHKDGCSAGPVTARLRPVVGGGDGLVCPPGLRLHPSARPERRHTRRHQPRICDGTRRAPTGSSRDRNRRSTRGYSPRTAAPRTWQNTMRHRSARTHVRPARSDWGRGRPPARRPATDEHTGAMYWGSPGQPPKPDQRNPLPRPGESNLGCVAG